MTFNYEVVLTESYRPSTGDRAYHSERVVQRFEDPQVAAGVARAYNKEALPNQFYSVRKIKEQ